MSERRFTIREIRIVLQRARDFNTVGPTFIDGVIERLDALPVPKEPESGLQKLLDSYMRTTFDSVRGGIMARQHHHLKTETNFYQLTALGIKNFEVRFNDRKYQKYDMVYLKEVVHEHETGRELPGREIEYVLRDCDTDGIKAGWVVLGFSR